MQFAPPVPILRSFDEARAKQHYVDYLGFRIDWAHRFADDLPLYMQLTRGHCVLHLSEHHGDCCPGAQVRIQVTDLDALHQELSAKQYKYARPGIETMPWGERSLQVADPFGNRLTFFQPLAQSAGG